MQFSSSKLGYSPTQLIMSQNIRFTVPVAEDNLKPQFHKISVDKQRD